MGPLSGRCNRSKMPKARMPEMRGDRQKKRIFCGLKYYEGPSPFIEAVGWIHKNIDLAS